MNEAPDPLESELAAFRPHELSPELRQRIVAKLGPWPLIHWRWTWAAFLVADLAACLLVFCVHHNDRPSEVAPLLPSSRPEPAREADAAPPTLQAYRSALARSRKEVDALPDELDAMLARQTVHHVSSLATQPTPRAFDPADRRFQKLTGEP